MKFKEFEKWCNDRAADGHWGPVTAMACMDIIHKTRKIPFWRRERFWKKNYETRVMEEIITPINSIINVMNLIANNK